MDYKKDEINAMLREAQRGNPEIREKLIGDHLIFVKKIVSKYVNGCEDINSREEYSIGLTAFNEAIDSYKPGLRSFRSFAADVIRKRLIDYHRSQSRHKRNTFYIADLHQSPELAEHDAASEQVEVSLEMESFLTRLSEHGIDLRDLIKETPKHADSRVLCVRIAQAITRDPRLRGHFQKYGSLPLKMLLERIRVNVKTVERHRKYIIALCLILLSDLDLMKGYVEQLGKGGGKDA